MSEFLGAEMYQPNLESLYKGLGIDTYIMPEREELIIYDSPPNSGILNIHIPVEYGPCYIDSRRILLADFS